MSDITSAADIKRVLRINNPWLSADDLDGEIEVTIDRVEEHVDEQFEDGKRTVVAVHFTDHDKGLVLNHTNTDILVEKLGKDVTKWKGQTVILFPARLAQAAFGRKYGVRVKEG